MRVNKVLIIVNTHFNLIQAIQIKRTILKNSKVDIFLGREELKKVYLRGKLSELFDRVFFLDGYNHKQSVMMFFFPKTFVRKATHMKYIQYDEVFFWNLDWIVYNYFKSSSNKNVKWHIYGEAIGSFLKDMPDNPPSYGKSVHGRLLDKLDRIIWGWRSFDSIEHDFYLFNPEYYQGVSSCEHKRIPSIDLNDRSLIGYLNDVWGYKPVSIREKIIYLDAEKSVKGNYGANESVDTVSDIVGKDMLIVKPHPATDIDKYSLKQYKIMDSDYPFELFCFNSGLEDKLLLCNSTSAALIPYMCFNMTPRVIATFRYIDFNLPNPFKDQIMNLWLDMEKRNNTITLAKSEGELVSLIKSFLMR